MPEHMTAEAVAAGVAAAREARRAEYSRYVATEAIDILGVRAFNEGDPVPVGHVEGYDRPEVVDGVPTGRTEHIDPVVDSDYVKKVTAKKATAQSAAATKES